MVRRGREEAAQNLVLDLLACFHKVTMVAVVPGTPGLREGPHKLAVSRSVNSVCGAIVRKVAWLAHNQPRLPLIRSSLICGLFRALGRWLHWLALLGFYVGIAPRLLHLKR